MAVERQASLSRVHVWLTAQSAILVLASVNRLSDLTMGYVAANEFLRRVDLLNMLVLPLASTLVLWLLKREIERNQPVATPAARLALELALIVAIYLLAASYGVHEVTNYLNLRFCLDNTEGLEVAGSELCRIIAFNDDEFSHYVFFAGFSMLNASLLLLQAVHPFEGTRPGGPHLLLLLANGALIALAIFANLGFEEIGLDLYVVVGLTLLAYGLLWRRGTQPLIVYYAMAYGLGLLLTIGYGVLGRGQ